MLRQLFDVHVNLGKRLGSYGKGAIPAIPARGQFSEATERGIKLGLNVMWYARLIIDILSRYSTFFFQSQWHLREPS